MNKFFYPLSLMGAFLSLMACNSSPKGIETGLDQRDSLGSEATDSLTQNDVRLSDCYLATIGRDSAFMEIKASGGKVSGNLHYLPQDREAQQGTIQGEISHDTIMVEFDAKGFPSRELTFLVRDEQIVEGLGDQILDKGKLVYKDKAKIDYTGHSYIFTPSECKQQEGKTERKVDSHL